VKITLNRFPVARGADHACSFRSPFCASIIAVFLCLVATVPGRCQAIPEFFGTYAVVDGKLAPMIGGRGSFTPSQTNLQVYNFYTMAADTENAFIFEGGEVHFLVFDAAVADASESIELYKLPFARNLITQPDALAQVGGLLSQITRQGGPPQNSASPMQKYIVAKTDALKVELLQKPVSGQPQMVQLVPASKLEAGVYGLFAVRVQGGQRVIIDQLFELKSGSETPDCIDLAVTGGAGGAIEAHDARMTRPYYLAKEGYVACGASSSEGQGGAFVAPAAPDLSARKLVAACNDYAECFHGGMAAYQSGDWESAVEGLKAATGHDSTKGEGWVWLGRAFLGAGRTEEFSAAWDKALALGISISVDLCRQRGLAWCEHGTLLLDARTISFAGKSQLFSAAPSEVTAHGFEGNAATMPVSFFKLKVGNKDYTFDPVPVGVTCEAGAAQLTCPPPGVAQQMAIGIYVLNAIPKLASGAFGKSN
jgi:hypothetical protein